MHRGAALYAVGTHASPRAVVETWVARFNAADVQGLATLYHEDAVNHQVAKAPVTGRAAIAERFTRQFDEATPVCIVEAIHVAGEVVTVEWHDPRGLRGCRVFTVRDGLIVRQRGYWDKGDFQRIHGLSVG